ncbi:hypothetical protein A9Q99_23955 [Gammaproteobacteria bacterium 45_16_T64]|nr:hypothetical protein A9Q99_23955 [Gammaproteobacteria bacterium 45_16_T64]
MFGTYVDLISTSMTSSSVIQRAKQQQKENYYFVELDQCFIRYRMEGEGKQTIVFATDPPAHLEDYDDLINHLKDDYKIVIFELPGFGFSLSKITMSYQFESCVNVLLTFLDTLNAAPYALAFPCASGYFALRMAEKSPDTISHLIMLQTPDWKEEQCWKKRLDPKHIMSTPIVGQLIMKTKKRDIAHQWIDFVCHTPEVGQHIQKHCAHNFDQGASYSLASALQVSLSKQEPQFTPLTQPAIALYGKSDRSHKTTNFHSIKKYFHSIDVFGLDDVGHLPELEAPQRVANYIQELLG